jgi:biotin transport system substrate-specific component
MQTVLPRRIASNGRLDDLAGTPSGRILLALSANALLVICAHLSLPLFFTPVPLTLQTFAVVLTGLLLGPSLACSTMVLYLAEGAMGLPVFSPAGPGGAAQLLGLTGGFLMSYPLAAAVAGFLVRAHGSRMSRFAAAVVAASAADVIILLTGGAWLSHLSQANLHTAAALGVIPFLPGEIIKIMAASAAFAGLARYVRD